MPEAVRERDPRQECGCPPWVTECVHFDHAQVWIASFGEHGHWVHGPSTIDNPDEWREPNRRTHGPTGCGCPHFTDIEDARTELARRAELLRLGGDVSNSEKKAAG